MLGCWPYLLLEEEKLELMLGRSCYWGWRGAAGLLLAIAASPDRGGAVASLLAGSVTGQDGEGCHRASLSGGEEDVRDAT